MFPFGFILLSWNSIVDSKDTRGVAFELEISICPRRSHVVLIIDQFIKVGFPCLRAHENGGIDFRAFVSSGSAASL